MNKFKAYFTLIGCLAILIMGSILSYQEANRLISNTLLITTLLSSISGLVISIAILIVERR